MACVVGLPTRIPFQFPPLPFAVLSTYRYLFGYWQWFTEEMNGVLVNFDVRSSSINICLYVCVTQWCCTLVQLADNGAYSYWVDGLDGEPFFLLLICSQSQLMSDCLVFSLVLANQEFTQLFMQKDTVWLGYSYWVVDDWAIDGWAIYDLSHGQLACLASLLYFCRQN